MLLVLPAATELEESLQVRHGAMVLLLVAPKQTSVTLLLGFQGSRCSIGVEGALRAICTSRSITPPRARWKAALNAL